MTANRSSPDLEEMHLMLGELEELRLVPADWPAKPAGHVRSMVEALARFPAGTRFFPATTYGACLLVTADRDASSDSLNVNLFHVALWQEHLVAAAAEGWIKDVVLQDDGDFLLPLRYFRLTDLAHRSVAVWRLSQELAIWPLFAEVEPLLIQGRHDTAVREAAVHLEEALRQAVRAGSELYGLRLVDELFRQMGKAEAQASTNLRGRMRTFFAFVRNDFAHSPRELSLVEAFFFIVECCHLFNWVRRRKRQEGDPLTK